MAWGRYESSFVKHPKVQAIPDAKRPGAIAFHLSCTLYSAEVLTDGFVPHGVLSRLGHEVGLKRHKPTVDLLVDVGLLEPVAGGYVVHDYLDYNPSSGEVKRLRKGAAERQQRRREQLKLDGTSQRDTSAVSQRDNADVSQRDVTADALARADAPAHGRARPAPSPSLKPSGVREGEKGSPPTEPPTPLEAPPALRIVPDPEPELTAEERERNAAKARALVERVTPEPPSAEPTDEEIERREQARRAAAARLAHHDEPDADADIPLH